MRSAPPALLWLLCATAVAADDGEYLFHAAGCLACHTAEGGEPLAGGRAFETPYGVFYSPNITPDTQTGIGDWHEQAFVDAVRHGTAPNGTAYFPVFPYPSYRLMTDQDARLIHRYLQTRKPVRQVNREHDLAWWLARWMMKPWQRWVLGDPPPVPTGNPRGHYLVNALGHCGECHTPRNLAGVLDHSHHLGGTAEGPEGEAVPNITPHREQGIGKWSADDLAYFLETGALPDGDYTGSVMSEVIDNTTSRLTDGDRKAIVDYLRATRPLPTP